MNVTDASERSVLNPRFSADHRGTAPEEDPEIETLA
jgi:hypothetical protein